MLSLSEELGKLSELFISGILSEDEFKAAKDAIIRRFATATQPSQASPSQVSCSEREGQTQPLASSFGIDAYLDGVGSFKDNSMTPFVRIDVREFEEDAIGAAQRGKAYKLLEKVIQNLRQFPYEPKYRRLRLSHPTLREQLFAVPGSMCFLQSLGFAPDMSGDFLEMPHPPMCDLLSEATEAIAFLHRRDAEALARTREHARLRQGFALEIRRERSAKAMAVGEFRAYLVQEFCADDAGDGLYSSAANLTTLRTILANAGDPRCLRLRLANASVRRAVVQQRGGLELLLDGAAAELQESADGPVLVLSPAAAGAGLRIVDEIAGAVRRAREERREAERAVAAEAMRAEVRRARQREAAHTQTPSQAQTEDEETGSGAPQRRPIPVAEAVQILLGKKRQENDAAE